jgi:16S rRNA (cytosine967-C5)-methyltransferase
MEVKQNYLIKQALEIIRGYAFNEPFHQYLKGVFRAQKQMGSRDRRNLRALSYAWFRMGTAGVTMDENERMLTGLFLAYDKADPFAERMFRDHETYKPELLTLPIAEKWKIVTNCHEDISLSDLFPLQDSLMEEVKNDDFLLSHFTRPLVWLRMRRDKKEEVLAYLRAKEIEFGTTDKSEYAISVEADEPIHETEIFEKGWIEIQDLSSQLTGNYYQPNEGEYWYDACAASGGKSLLLMDMGVRLDLTVSDIRSSVLENLKVRFERNKIYKYTMLVADLANGLPEQLVQESFDAIILDVPCSGSGTWGRNPENRLNFDKSKLRGYTALQEKILVNVLPLLNEGGRIIYSTCSVFKAENIGVLKVLAKHPTFKVTNSELLTGYNHQADTLYVAEITRL